jgi:hypothetical protein
MPAYGLIALNCVVWHAVLYSTHNSSATLAVLFQLQFQTLLLDSSTFLLLVKEQVFVFTDFALTFLFPASLLAIIFVVSFCQVWV